MWDITICKQIFFGNWRNKSLRRNKKCRGPWKREGPTPSSSFLYSTHYCTTVECWEKGTAAEKGIHSGKALQEGGVLITCPSPLQKGGKWMWNENSPSAEKFSTVFFQNVFLCFPREGRKCNAKKTQESFFSRFARPLISHFRKHHRRQAKKKDFFSFPFLSLPRLLRRSNAYKCRENRIGDRRRRKEKEKRRIPFSFSSALFWDATAHACANIVQCLAGRGEHIASANIQAGPKWYIRKKRERDNPYGAAANNNFSK